MFKAAAKILLPKSKLGYNLPDDHWFTYVKESSRYSPDIAKLEEHEHQLYFAGDETKMRRPMHRFIEGSEYKCPAFTQQSFNFWNPDSPLLPVVAMEATDNPLPGYPPIAKIKGEIYKIRSGTLLTLDIEKQNGVQFERKRVRLLVPYRLLKWVHDSNIPEDIEIIEPNGRFGLTFERMCIIRAWMYVGIPEYWDKLISKFDYGSVQTHTSKNRRWCQEYYNLK